MCTRLKRDEHISVPQANTIIQKGDLLHLVGEIPLLRKIKLVLGEEVDVPLSSFTGDLRPIVLWSPMKSFRQENSRVRYSSEIWRRDFTIKPSRG